jgi:hypothetical protein
MSELRQPSSLRARLRELQAELDEASDAVLGHLRDHGCQGKDCAEAKALSDRVADAQYQLNMTRFLNEE